MRHITTAAGFKY